ncbi:glycosyltransferase [Effusibacillus dendaii]|uniref:Glycosyl transferase n=1 Tax=Effusibacillus dendaii TaxID=2743772 RepID=A0A7I8DAJ2_9BACL|nr:glycosyltransferase [Effusibacillus dendaii]BCJ87007.1 glycosyl transferase [Effusibacillus dendaii]
MKILIVLPPDQPKSGGNITYSNRIKRGLARHGIQILIKPLDKVEPQDYRDADIVHAFNAFRTGRFVLPVLKETGKPMVLTITGTDINEYMTKEETRKETYGVVQYASRIISLTESSRQELLNLVPDAKCKSLVINLGVDLPKPRGKSRADFGLDDNSFIFMLPAGIRPVKNPLSAYQPISRLHKRFPNVRFVVAGPEMDPALTAEFKNKMDAVDWAHYLGEVEHTDMPDLILASDVVLNTSRSEGLSHALLEAMSLGKPVLASKVPGNIDLIKDGQNGFLFANEDEFVDKGSLYIENADLRETIAAAGRQWVQEQYSVEREMETFRHVYEQVLCKECCL